MKKLLIIACAVTYSTLSFAADSAKPKLTKEQREERKYRFFGGYVNQPIETKVVSIVNEQNSVNAATLESVASEMSSMLSIPVSVGASKDVAVTIRVTDSDAVKDTLVVLPDSATAIVGMKVLAADKPSTKVLDTRLRKQLWRGLIYTLGGGNTFVPTCVMKQVRSLKDLDEIKPTNACPEAFLRASDSAAKLGIRPMRRVSYRQACREGWAPAPTNDVQKAIAECIKTEKGFEQQTKDPTNPIRIKR